MRIDVEALGSWVWREFDIENIGYTTAHAEVDISEVSGGEVKVYPTTSGITMPGQSRKGLWVGVKLSAEQLRASVSFRYGQSSFSMFVAGHLRRLEIEPSSLEWSIESEGTGRITHESNVLVTNHLSRDVAIVHYLKRTVDEEGNPVAARFQYVLETADTDEPEQPSQNRHAGQGEDQVPDYVLDTTEAPIAPTEVPGADRTEFGWSQWQEVDFSFGGLVPVILGLKFPFFGSRYQVAWVSQDGYITFESSASPGPSSIPSPRAPNLLIAAFWGGGLHFGRESHVYHKQGAIRWEKMVPDFNDGVSVSVTLFLKRDGSYKIVFDNASQRARCVRFRGFQRRRFEPRCRRS